MDLQIIKRTLSFIIYGSQADFDHYMQLREWFLSTKEVQIPPDFHSFTLDQRLKFINQQMKHTYKYFQSPNTRRQLNFLQEFIGIEAARPFCIQPFYQQFLRTMNLQRDNQFGSILLEEFDFNKKSRYHYENIQTFVESDGQGNYLTTNSGIYKSGLYYGGLITDSAVVLCRDSKNKMYLALCRIRDTRGKLVEGVEERWLGKTLQLTNNWAIGFRHVKVVYLHDLGNEWQKPIKAIEALIQLQDAWSILRDVFRAVYLGVKYCSMRKQFPGDTKKELPIIDYQVTLERLITGLSFAMIYTNAFYELRSNYKLDVKDKKLDIQKQYTYIRMFVVIIMEKGMQMIEDIREAMGGFGYLRFSGIPLIQERCLWYYSQYTQYKASDALALTTILKDIENNQDFISKFLGYFTSIPAKKEVLEGKIKKENENDQFFMFWYYVTLLKEELMEILEQKVKVTHPIDVFSMAFKFIDQYVIQEFFNILAYQRNRQANYVLDAIFFKHILRELLKYEDDEDNFKLISKSYTNVLLEIKKNFKITLEAFEFENTFTDCIVGIENEDKFYEKVIQQILFYQSKADIIEQKQQRKEFSRNNGFCQNTLWFLFEQAQTSVMIYNG